MCGCRRGSATRWRWHCTRGVDPRRGRRSDQAAVADVQVIDGGLDEGGDPAAGPVDAAELERMRRLLHDANPEDFDIS